MGVSYIDRRKTFARETKDRLTAAEFAKYVARLREAHPCSPLSLAGVQHDNSTRDLIDAEQKQRWRNIRNTFEKLFERGQTGQDDFVWLGEGERAVRIPRWLGSGGHPALAGLSLPHCAGELRYDSPPWINFKSGHYHPRIGNAVHFVCDMIERSLAETHPALRDQVVQELSAMRLRVYHGNEEEDTVITCLDEVAERLGLHVTRAASATPAAAAAAPSPHSPRSSLASSSSSARQVEDRAFNRSVAVSERMEERQICKCVVCDVILQRDRRQCIFCDKFVCPNCINPYTSSAANATFCKGCSPIHDH